MATKKRSVPLPDSGIDWSSPVGEFQPSNPAANDAATADQPSSALRRAADYIPTLVKSAIAVPEFAVGMADLATGGRVGKFLENEGGAIGFRPKEARAALDEFYSPEQKAAFQEVQNADGFIGTGMAALRNPSVIAQSAVESLGLMGAGGVVARGVGALAPRLSGTALGAVGEGVTGAGSAAEQIRQETADGLLTGKQAALAATSGLADTMFGALGGKIAQRMGIADVDTMLAGKGSPTTTKSFVKSVLEGAVSEGLLEEFPQSIAEQVAQNAALDKPLSEGVDQQAVLGLLTGGIMGAGANAAHSLFPAAHPADEIRATKLPESGPLTKGLNAAIETHADAVESATAEAATQTRRQQTAPIVERLRLLPPAQQEEALQMLALADNQKAPGSVRRRAQNRLDYLFSSVAPQGATPAAQTTETDPQDAVAPVAPTVEVPNEPAAQPAEQPDAIAQREADRPTPAITPRQDGDILTNSGVPFRNMTAAMRALGRAGDGYELAPVEGGLVVRESAAPQPEQTQHAPAEATEQVPVQTDAPQQVEVQHDPATLEAPPTQAADVAGEPIDKEWTAFTPESGTKGIPRADMPQVQASHRGPLVNFLNARGITHETVEIPAGELKPTQAEFSPAKVQQAKDFTDTDRSILVSSDGHVLDGHHQWMAKLDNNEPVKAIRLNAPIADLVSTVREFPSAGQADGATTAQPTGTLQEQWQDAVKRGDTEAASKINDQIVAEKQARKATEAAPADDTNQTSGTRAEAQAAADQAPAPARSDAAAPASVPTAGAAAATEAAGVKLSGDEIAPKDVVGKPLRTKVIAWSRTELGGKSFRNQSTGDEIGVTWQGIKHATSNANDPELRLVAGLPDMLRNAQYEGAEPDARGRPDIKAIHNYSVRADLAGESLLVGIVVREMKDGHRFYDHFIIPKGNPAGISGATPREKVLGDQPAAGSISVAADDTAVTSKKRSDPAAKASAARDDKPAEPATETPQTQPDVATEQAPASEVVPAEGNAQAPKPTSKIEDFGEKLAGARKDYAALLKDALDVDVSAEPLSKSWPEPDYQKLLDGGADPFVVAWVHASRDEVPTKPQTAWKLRGWVDSVKLLRSVSQQLLTGEISKDALTAKLDAREFANLKSAVGGRAELYQLVGHDKSLKGITLQKHHYTLYRGEQNVTKWAIEQKAKATAFSNWPREIAVADTKQEVLDEFKSKIDSLDLGKKAKGQASQFVIYRKRGQDGTWIGKKIGREYIDLHKADDVNAAREYLAANAEALEAKLMKYRETPFERKAENQLRVGDDHRNGAPVTPEVFADTFGFRGVQFGNYVEQGRRQSDLNEAFDGLMDMAAVLGIPPRALSLNGQLGLAFGARGKGGKNAPAAHFEPGNVIINLTKGGGPGSLAHEWWHGLDNYFARRSGDNSGYVTGGAKTDAMRDELRAAFNSVQRATQVPTLRRRAAELDKRRSKPYWNTPIELSARAFESYVIAKLQDQNAANDYLANVVDEQVWNIDEAARSELFGGEKVETYPYPGQAELPAVRAAFDEFFKIVETIRDDAGNVAMLSRSANYNDAVDAVLDGSKPESDSVRLSGSLDVLEALGVPSLPLATTGDRLAKMHYDHGLTRSDLKALPELLANPVMVFDSATKPGSKVLVLDLWRRGMPVIAAVHPNVQLKRVDVNLLASAYPKDRPEQLGVWYREKLLRYADKDKARAWATNGGVQFPWLVQLQRGLESSVLGPKDIGKSALSRSDQRDLPEASQRAFEIEKLVSQIVSRWNGSPEVIVVDSLSDPRVPERIRAEDARQQSQGATGAPEGMFYAGKVYLVASELHGDADVVRVLFHEALGHAGLRGTFGKELGTIVDRLAVLNQGKVRAKAKQYGLDYDKPSDRRAAAEEVLAEMAQTRPEIGWVKRAIAAIRLFLREHIPGFSRMRYSDADLIGQFILPARRFVEQGQPKKAPDGLQSGIAAAMLSRSPSEVLRGINQESIRNAFLDATTSHDNVNLWAKTVGTQYDKAQRHPQTFGRVFNAVQDYIKDISSFANAAADQAPHILPKLDKLSDLKPERLKASGDRNATKADLNAVGAVIFQGTLDKQLLDRPALLAKGLTKRQADLYEEFRAAVNQSLEDVAKTEIVRLAGTAGAPLASQALAAPTAREAADILAERLRQQGLAEDADGLYGKVDTVEKLKAEGYAPLMRFGKHTVHIQRGGETLFFGMYESRTEANAMARKLRGDAEFAGLPVEQGVMSQEAYKLFNGLSIDSLELFANEVGGQDNPVYQDFLKLTKNNRSALKRLIHRNGTAGFSTNTERVLASFVTSNARLASGNLHLGRAKAAANDIPKELGDLKDEAVRLVDYVQNPQEEAQAVRGLLFTTFIGGSVASALVNMTQPFVMTLPHLSQYGGLAKAGARMVAALKIVASGNATGELGQALRRAEADGIVSPQEIHHLQAATTDSLGNNPYLKKAAFIWGSMFSLAEQFNRRLSFVAAYQTALDNKMADPFAFAEKAVIETQGLYNKGNKANWARGPIGATAMTFKQFSTSYVEWITRMYQSGPEGKKAAVTALAILMLAGGAGGLPFADDVDDLIDTLAQALGYDFNSKRAKRKFISDTLGLGDTAAEVATRGLTALPGFPMDLSMRLGMGNLLPATGIFLRSNTDRSKDLLEVAGAAGGVAKMALDAGQQVLQGEPLGAAKAVVPVAIQNVAKAIEMWNTGEYRNQKGARVMDVDGTDALMKGVGFQPSEVARESARVGELQRTIQLAKNVESDLSGRMAQARVDGDLDAEQAARQELIDWNRKNPDSPIRIRPADIARRARELRASRADRLVKSAPKELRPAVQGALN